jgi:hypothetical protein
MVLSTKERPVTEIIDITMWLLDRIADLARFIGRWP